MSAVHVWSAAALLLIVLGGWRTVSAADPVRQLLGLNVMAAGTSLLLVTVGQVGGPVSPPAARTMATAGIVVAFAVTAFGAHLAHRVRTPGDSGLDADRAPEQHAPAAGEGAVE